MDKSAIRNFATHARIKLIDQITQKAFELGITAKMIEEPEVFKDGFAINGKFFKKYEIKQREDLVKQVRQKGFTQVVEEVAYTWFNRLVAIRFMEVNGYLPAGVRVLSSSEPNKAEPDIIREVANVDLGLNLDVVYRLQDEQDTEELFKYILVKQCNQLGEIMPVVFEKIADFTELLLPDNLLVKGSIIRDLVTSIPEEDWQEQVEIIGWLYQYYISEKKDQVFAALKKNQKITKENIPAATQLFTPEWIVKYMVENSLGRLWLESHPDPELQARWKYYLEETEQEPEVRAELDKLVNKDLKPEDIKVLDPCMGSGHILVYAFDVLYEIYKSAGYPERDIPKLILENNLYGLDIDDRAGQLAYFAVLMKARSYNRRILREKLELNLCAIQESNDIPKQEVVSMFAHLTAGLWSNELRADIEYIIEVFQDAKDYGSIIEVKPIDFKTIELAIEAIRQDETVLNVFEASYKAIILDMMPVIVRQGRILSEKYDGVVTNPPYMGNRGMNYKLSSHIKTNFPDSYSDVSTVFMEVVLKLSKRQGYTAMINIPSWMFLSTFESLRIKLIDNSCLINMAHFGRGIFGSDFGTTAFILRNEYISGYKGRYKRLFFVQGAVDNVIQKEKWFLEGLNEFIVEQSQFFRIPGSPIAYWASNQVLGIFQNRKSLKNFAELRVGIQTGNNERFLRLWYEVSFAKLGLEIETIQAAAVSHFKWFPYNKGGAYKRWYGNFDFVIDWEKDGFTIKNCQGQDVTVRTRTEYSHLFFHEGISWSKVTIGSFSARFIPKGSLFDVAGCTLFPESGNDFFFIILGLLNTKVTALFLSLISPTLNYEVNQVSVVPMIEEYSSQEKKRISEIVKKCIDYSRNDWDAFEISWNFAKHPLLLHKQNSANSTLLEEAYNNWEVFAKTRFTELKANEEELNRIFIEVYNLQEELTSEVDDEDISIRKADRTRDIRSFLSYTVGCMFGRYSLDEDGLIYAGGGFNASRYKTNPVEPDSVIPITDDEYFEDDIVSRCIDFVRVTFGAETLEQNIDYIAKTLGQKANETSRQTIRRYFLTDFHKDHVQVYQKRPIYWLFDSGKADGFKALIYMHRYDIGTVATVRTDYLHVLQRKYEAEINRLDIVLDSAVSAREKSEAKKKKEKIQKQLTECFQYDQVIAHIAHQKIAIDLDDGVKVNYAKFQEVEIPQGEGKKPLKANLLASI